MMRIRTYISWGDQTHTREESIPDNVGLIETLLEHLDQFYPHIDRFTIKNLLDVELGGIDLYSRDPDIPVGRIVVLDHDE